MHKVVFIFKGLFCWHWVNEVFGFNIDLIRMLKFFQFLGQLDESAFYFDGLILDNLSGW